MLKIKINTFFTYFLFGIILFTYIFPGFIQFFIGVPSTVYAVILILLINGIVLIDILLRRKVIFNKVIVSLLVIAILIIISGMVNGTNLSKVLLYLNFVFIPLSINYIFAILEIRGVFLKEKLSRFFRFIALIQLPVVILQKYGYDLLIKYSNANQKIAEVDFMFGSFALKVGPCFRVFLNNLYPQYYF
ncbi:hypothetical protein [Thalassobellus suaedae]|uniref:Uncharacterized protein n=1 Tax=Thalassobellus suaedae TaxID=3074124 RepID=A0ABY9XRP6_9FLAO|nr:hypothetical protein RHP51_16120 [Flavobacteriaceae bacterium HL-DH14]